MEKLKNAVKEIAYTRDRAKLSSRQRSLVPVLYVASTLYRLGLSLRHFLFTNGIFIKHRLPVPVISVGNLTWGGNGKTPMVEFLAGWLADSGISPLILSRGYAGGDEAKMLQRHFLRRTVKVGVGADRVATAARYFARYGYVDPRTRISGDKYKITPAENHHGSDKIGAVILDDGMQHWSLLRDVEIVMVNALTLWGNSQLLPLGPLREPLTALRRADIAVVHHADLASEENTEDIKLRMLEIRESLIILFTRMSPSYFFEVRDINSRRPVGSLSNRIVLCVSAIGCANAFVRSIEKLGAVCVDRLDFSDHHIFQDRDIEMVRRRLGELEKKFGLKPVVVVTEKDYDRCPDVLKSLYPYDVLVLCSELQIIPRTGCSVDKFKKFLEQAIKVNLSSKYLIRSNIELNAST